VSDEYLQNLPIMKILNHLQIIQYSLLLPQLFLKLSGHFPGIL